MTSWMSFTDIDIKAEVAYADASSAVVAHSEERCHLSGHLAGTLTVGVKESKNPLKLTAMLPLPLSADFNLDFELPQIRLGKSVLLEHVRLHYSKGDFRATGQLKVVVGDTTIQLSTSGNFDTSNGTSNGRYRFTAFLDSTAFPIGSVNFTLKQLSVNVSGFTNGTLSELKIEANTLVAGIHFKASFSEQPTDENEPVHLCVRACGCICVCIYMCMRARARLCACVCMCVHVHARVYICKHNHCRCAGFLRAQHQVLIKSTTSR